MGGTPLIEYTPTAATPPCDAYVESNLHTPVSYPVETIETDPWGESFKQHWPVTPYGV